MSAAPLVVLGAGFTGRAALALAHENAPTRTRLATVRTPAHADLDAVSFLVADTLDARALDAFVPGGADVLVTFPPDGATDARIAHVATRARAVVYLSSTGVYGDATGRIDERTAVDAGTPKQAQRLAAEALWRDRGACVLRAAGIYGPFRGVHRRLLAGTFRLSGDGSRVVSRVHVDDLAGLALAVLDRALRGETFVVADDTPVPQREAVAWLCARLALPFPPSVPLDEAPETLRHDRAVDNARIRAATGYALRYPGYREGFEACLAREGVGDGPTFVPCGDNKVRR